MFLETQAGSEFAMPVRLRHSTSHKRPVNEKLRHIFHFPFSICHLPFVICHFDRKACRVAMDFRLG